MCISDLQGRGCEGYHRRQGEHASRLLLFQMRHTHFNTLDLWSEHAWHCRRPPHTARGDGGRQIPARAGTASSKQRLEESEHQRELDGFVFSQRLFTASGAAAANEQVPQARVRAEEQGKDQSTAINRGRRNRGDTDPCKLQDGKTIPNTAPGTHAWESVMQSQAQTKLSPHSEIQ